MKRISSWVGALWAKPRGQSIVEMALFLPILLAVMVSIVEVGNSLNAFLTVGNSAREGARFGAAGGSDADITQVITDTMKLRLDIAPSNTDVFVIRGKTSSDGTAMESWQEARTYGSPPPETSGVSSAQVLSDLQSQGITNTASLDFVVAVAHYDLKSLLGVPLVSNLSEMIPLSAYAVMPIQSLVPPENTVGCDVYPIGVSAARLEDLLGGDKYFKFQNVNPSDQDHFAWFYWDCPVCEGGGGSPLKLAEYLSHPTNDPVFRRDLTSVRIGDWVPGFKMDAQLLRSQASWWDQLERVMNGHVNTGRTLLMVVFDHTQTRPSSCDFCKEYRVVDFATVRILRYNIESYQGRPDRFHTVQFEYVGGYTACGQQY